MFAKSLALFLFPALAAAQYGYAPPGPASPSGSSAASASATATATALAVAPTAPASNSSQMNIDVAFNKTFVFHPPNITASVGTLVTFYFPNFGLNHSVTQSTFANPCTYLAANTSSNTTTAGFDSDLQSAATFTINITDTSPIWFFCKQIGHCGLGMVGSINAIGDTYTQYLANAKAIGGNEVTTPANGPVVAGVHANATGPPVPDLSSSPTPSPSATGSGTMKVTTSIEFALFATVLAIAFATA